MLDFPSVRDKCAGHVLIYAFEHDFTTCFSAGGRITVGGKRVLLSFFSRQIKEIRRSLQSRGNRLARKKNWFLNFSKKKGDTRSDRLDLWINEGDVAVSVAG